MLWLTGKCLCFDFTFFLQLLDLFVEQIHKFLVLGEDCLVLGALAALVPAQVFGVGWTGGGGLVHGAIRLLIYYFIKSLREIEKQSFMINLRATKKDKGSLSSSECILPHPYKRNTLKPLSIFLPSVQTPSQKNPIPKILQTHHPKIQNQFILFILFISRMKIIINELSKKYQSKVPAQRSQLQRYIQSHRFYNPSMDVGAIITRLQAAIKKNNQLGSRGQSKEKQYQTRESLEQLSLYLNKDNNKQIFTLFELITTHPQGITYDVLSKKLKTDIITISHYCCKLKKLRLIDWNHGESGVNVFPKVQEGQRDEKEIKYRVSKNQIGYDFKGSFIFKELGMNQNIWINISSQESVSKGGMTNQEIKRKIMKHAENKMVRRTVQSMKYFERNAERQGKVFEFKYKNQTEQIKDEIIRKNQIQEEIEILNESIYEWLRAKFPEFQGESFLLDLINNKFKDYISSLGIKQSKRQCTPLKLNRYIKVLNYLNKEGGMRENQLRNLIVKDQKELNNSIGIMHKRSLMGILEGLRSLKIIFEEDGYYYPSWVQEEKKTKRKEILVKKVRDQYEEPPKKRNHVDNHERSKESKLKETVSPKFKKISEKKYHLELLAALLGVSLDRCLKKLYRKAFNRIVYVQRKKASLQYTPQTNVLYLLEDYHEISTCSLDYNKTLQSFYRSLDDIVQLKGRKEEERVECENELIKFLRKNPYKNCNSVRIKYGKNWRVKFQELKNGQIIEIDEEQVRVKNFDSLLI